MDNSWVVPYNRFLLLKYNAHINVELCSTVKSVKYLYKYTYTGYDYAKLEINVGKEDKNKSITNNNTILYDEVIILN